MGGVVFVGYHFNEILGIEANYRVYPTTTYLIESYYGDITLDYNLQAFSVAAKVYTLFYSKSPFNFYVAFDVAEVFGSAPINFYEERITTLSTVHLSSQQV